jgi:serine/threonine protein kinase
MISNTQYIKTFKDSSLYDNEKTVYEYIKNLNEPTLNNIVPKYYGYNDDEKRIFIENIDTYINIHNTIQKISSQQENLQNIQNIIHSRPKHDLSQENIQKLNIFSEDIKGVFRNALDILHSFGIIHNDIKPDNLAWKNGNPLFFDFDIAIIYLDDSSIINEPLKNKIHEHFSRYKKNLQDIITNIHFGIQSSRLKIMNNIYDIEKTSIPKYIIDNINDEKFFRILKIIDKISLERSFYYKNNGKIDAFDLHRLNESIEIINLKDELYKEYGVVSSTLTNSSTIGDDEDFSSDDEDFSSDDEA